MRKFNAAAMALAALLLSASSAMADALFDSLGIGVMYASNQDASPIDPKAPWKLYAEPDSGSALLGYVQRFEQPKEHGLHAFLELGKPKEESFMEKLRGGAEPTVVAQKPLADSPVRPGWYGLVVFEQRGSWYRLEHGWIERSDALQASTRYVTWKQALAHDDFESLKFRSDDMVPQIGKMAEMRAQAKFVPLGTVPVFDAPGSEKKTTDVAPPLRMAVMEQQGDWLKVFVVMGNCEATAGKSDFREGTIGWVQAISKQGSPQIRRQDESC